MHIKKHIMILFVLVYLAPTITASYFTQTHTVQQLPNISVYFPKRSSNLSSSGPLKIITSNLLANRFYAESTYLKDKTLEVSLSHRVKKFYELIKQEQPDILCLQECDFGTDTSWIEQLERLPLVNYALVYTTNGSKLGILFNANKLSFHGARTDDNAKIIAAKFETKGPTQKAFFVYNIHAPWSQAAQHRSLYKNILSEAGQSPVIAVGDWNTNGAGNTNKEVFINDVFSGFTELSQKLSSTARNVHTSDDFVKIDYIVVRGFTPQGEVTIIPENLNCLLPFTRSATNPHVAPLFNPISLDNHYSDHAALVVTVDFLDQTLLPTPAYEQSATSKQQLDRLQQELIALKQKLSLLYQKLKQLTGELQATVYAPVHVSKKPHTFRSQQSHAQQTIQQAYTPNRLPYRHQKYSETIGWGKNGFLVIEYRNGTQEKVAPISPGSHFVYTINMKKYPPSYGFKQAGGLKVH